MCSTGMDDLLTRLDSVLDALAAEDLDYLPPAAQLGRITRLAAAQAMLDSAMARSVRRAEVTQAAEDDGLKSTTSWLRGHCRFSPAAAARLVRNGRALEHLPAVAAAHATGAITGEQVTVIAAVATPANRADAADQGVDLSGVDAALAQVAATRPYADLTKVVHHYLARLDPDGLEPDPTQGRSLVLAKHPDGSVSGRFDLDAVGGEKLQAALESVVQASRPAGDERTRAQQLGDALVQLVDNELASGRLPFLRTVKPHVLAMIPVTDLVDPSIGPATAETGFGGLISAARARWLACDGVLSRVIMGPDSQPLDVGRSHRVVPPHIRRAVEVRDRHCVFACCEAPSWWCDVHHVREWLIDHGETSAENSGLLCERHHTKVHHGFRIERDPDGRWHTYRPDGTEILIPAALLLAS